VSECFGEHNMVCVKKEFGGGNQKKVKKGKRESEPNK